MAKKKSKKVKKLKKRNRIISIILISVFLLAASAFFYVSNNFSNILSDKIHEIYGQSKVAKYYQLDFKKLRVNLLNMSVRIFDVHLIPKSDEHIDYFNNNGSLNVQIGKIVIKQADIFNFIVSNTISIQKFTIEHSKIKINNPSGLFNPFAFVKDSIPNDSLKLKVNIQHISFDDTQLEYYGNQNEDVENRFRSFSMEIDDLGFIREPDLFRFSLKKLVSVLREAHFSSDRRGSFSLEQLHFGVSSMEVNDRNKKFSLDYENFFIQLINPRVITVDSLFTFSSSKIQIDEQNKRISISKAKIHPNMSKSDFVHSFSHQMLYPSVEIDEIQIANIDYDNLVEEQIFFADTVFINGLYADLYKDKQIPLDKSHFPKYLAAQIFGVKIPLRIKIVELKDVNIDFSLKMEDGRIGKIDINNIDGSLRNIQNKNKNEKLHLNAKGLVHNTIPFKVAIQFDYSAERFNYQGHIYKSNLVRMNSVVRSFAPVEIKKGILNSVEFAGHSSRTDSRGTMLFLYKDLNIKVEDNQVEKKKGFRNFVVSFAANTYLYSNNPVNSSQLPRRVNYFSQRDMNKGFLHLLVMSILEGIKETIAPSKENRKIYKSERKKQRKHLSASE